MPPEDNPAEEKQGWPCSKPGCTGSVTAELVTSDDGGFADTKYSCNTCGFVRWVDGADA